MPRSSREDLLAEVVVAGDDRLAVALGLELGAELAGEPLAQLEVVVDLAVEDQVVAAVEVGQRLVRVVDVDDRQPAEADDHVIVGPDAALVRAAVAHLDQRGLDLADDLRAGRRLRRPGSRSVRTR